MPAKNYKKPEGRSHIFSLRLTDNEYRILKVAAEQGHETKSMIIRKLINRLGVKE